MGFARLAGERWRTLAGDAPSQWIAFKLNLNVSSGATWT